MHRLTADLDAETAAMATTVLRSLAAPKPDVTEPDADDDDKSNTTGSEPTGADTAASGDRAGAKTRRVLARDDRSSGQRMHDALRAILKLALRSGQLPKSGAYQRPC